MTALRPQVGDAVELPDGVLAVVSVNYYSPDEVGICLLKDVYGGAFFYGPSVGAPGKGKEEYASVSGGPHPAVHVSRFIETDRTTEVNCWHWDGLPRAGGGVNYKRQVRLWKLRSE